jgi:mannose-6-phosphate isomerase
MELLTFEPIYKSMPWGGARLPGFLGVPVGPPLAPGDPVGEAWVLSDVEGNSSRVAAGPQRGRTLRELIAEFPRELFGDAGPPADGKFPLLLKFIDARQELSVQVHPDDALAERLRGAGQRGKTEAWVVLAAGPDSRIYAGFRPGITAGDFRAAMATGTTPETLHNFAPNPGDAVFLEAGTVHAIGANVLLFEVQQTSDITYRLYDWGRVDAKTGRSRELHVEDGLTCANFAAGPCHPVAGTPTADGRERLVECRHFTLHRTVAARTTLANAACRVLVVAAGRGTFNGLAVAAGSVVLVPACVREVAIDAAEPLTVLDCGLGTP